MVTYSFSRSISKVIKDLVVDSISEVASVAQWLEHWSCKPGVESSNLSGGFAFCFPFRPNEILHLNHSISFKHYNASLFTEASLSVAISSTKVS